MTQEEKQLLLKDLCARLPNGVKAYIEHDTFYDEIEPYDGTVNTNTINDLLHNEKLEVRPYLRPMSSMTEEERKELEHLSDEYFGKALDKYIQESLSLSSRNESRIIEYTASSVIIDWLNEHHFDFRGLIPMGLALEAPEDMYEHNEIQN